MAENDDRGERIADALFGDENNPIARSFEQAQVGPDFANAFEASDGVFISDVVDHATRFHWQAALFEKLGQDFPCVSMGDFEYAPIEVFSGPWPFSAYFNYSPYYAFPEFQYLLRESVRHSLSSPEFGGEAKERIRFFSPREAAGFIRRGVVRFLNSRFASATSAVASAQVPFTLYNQNPNHQIYVSSPYYLVKNSVFGGPSSPVTRSLYPGIYIFGVMGPVIHFNHTPQFETQSQFDIPRRHTTGTLVTI